MSRKNLKIVLAYDGREYLGWQKTRTGPTIEESLEKVLQKILQHEVTLQAASRTDAGVHASGQIVNFFTEKKIDLSILHRSVNALLPQDIVAREITLAPEEFHPTLDCKGKEYCYSICNGPVQLPMRRRYSWHIPRPLDFSNMRQTAKLLSGKQDYAAFCNVIKGSKYEDTIREIREIRIEDSQIVITGDNFLYKMVRNLVGTLVYVGLGKISLKEIPKIIESKDRTLAGITAPAHGLTLSKVFL